MQVEHSFFVGVQDVGSGNEMSNKALLEALTNITNLHGALVGQGTKDQADKRLSWVVLNWKVDVLRRARVCDTILVRTWAQQYTRVSAGRDYEVFGPDGGLSARATSRWTVVDAGSASLLRLTPEIMDPFGCEPAHQNYPGFQFPRVGRRPAAPISSVELRVSKGMIDCNRHVHNPVYLDFAAEVLPEGLDSVLFDHMELSYKREVKPGETVLIEYAREGEKHVVYVSDRADGSLHAVIALY